MSLARGVKLLCFWLAAQAHGQSNNGMAGTINMSIADTC